MPPSHNKGGGNQQNQTGGEGKHAQPTFCVAWYRDGGSEELDLETLDSLKRHTDWRLQLAGLQDYIQPEQVLSGSFAPDNGTFTDVSQIILQPLDALSRSLAEHLEVSMLSASSADQRRNGPGGGRKQRISFMRAQFVVDGGGLLWFMHCEELRVESEAEDTAHAGGPDSVAARRLREAKALEDAMEVGLKLRELLLTAARTGVSVSSSFDHFDRHGTGVVDPDDFAEGLSHLGFSLAPFSVQKLMEMVCVGSVGNAHFRVQDLVAFARVDETDADGETTLFGTAQSRQLTLSQDASGTKGGRKKKSRQGGSRQGNRSAADSGIELVAKKSSLSDARKEARAAMRSSSSAEGARNKKNRSAGAGRPSSTTKRGMASSESAPSLGHGAGGASPMRKSGRKLQPLGGGDASLSESVDFRAPSEWANDAVKNQYKTLSKLERKQLKREVGFGGAKAAHQDMDGWSANSPHGFGGPSLDRPTSSGSLRDAAMATPMDELGSLLPPLDFQDGANAIFQVDDHTTFSYRILENSPEELHAIKPNANAVNQVPHVNPSVRVRA